MLYILQKMQLDCNICKQTFNNDQRSPMILCTQQHLCCKECANILLQRNGPKSCPQCRQLLIRQKVVKFRLYEILLQKFKSQEEKRNQFLHEIIRDSIMLNNNTDKQYYQVIKSKAQKLISVKNYQTATLLLKSLIQKYPKQPNFIGIGSKEQEKGLCQNCGLDWYKKHYKVSSLDAEDILSFVYLKNPNYQTQKSYYERMFAKNPNNYKMVFGLSLTEHNEGNLDKALSFYQKVIQLKPSFSKAYEQIAFIYYQKNNKQMAIQYSEFCLKLQPSNIYANFILGDIAQEQKQMLQRFHKIISAEPRYQRAINQLGDHYFKLKKYQNAIQQYVACVSLNKDNIALIIKIGKCYIEMQEYNKAIQTILQIENRKKEKEVEFDYYYFLAKIQYLKNIYDYSIVFFKRCLKIDPFNENVYDHLGQISIILGKLEVALGIYKWMVSVNNANKKAYQQIITIYTVMKNYSIVTYWLRQWEKVQPQQTHIYALFADNYFRNENWNKCVIYCKKCILKKHQISKYYAKSIQALNKLKRYEQLKVQIHFYIKQCAVSQGQIMRMIKLEEKADSIIQMKKNKAT